MKTFEEAYSLVVNSTNTQNATEQISIFESLNRILAFDVKSDIPMPPFDKSAMDGYACRFEDRQKPLQVIEIIAAGDIPKKTIHEGMCAKIMTGAMMPKGANGVVKIEDTTSVDPQTIICNTISNAKNICLLGEDIQINTVLIEKGTQIKPQHIAVLAAVGLMQVSVYKKTTVGIISTGNELLEPTELLSPGKIRNSNGYQLYSQVLNQFAKPTYYGIATDDQRSLLELIYKATSENQITLLSGGVSMGDFDLVPQVIAELGFKTHFHSIAVQPGKPTLFAQKNDQFCFGLPGNPVSSFIQFELLVAPLIKKCQGDLHQNQNLKATLSNDYSRKNTARKSWVPVNIDEKYHVSIVSYHGSAHINAFVNANAIMEIPIGTSEIKKGELVNVRYIS